LLDGEEDGTVHRGVVSKAKVSMLCTRPTTPGDLLCERYRLEQELGRGGMGMVWQATDERLGRSIAVKILPQEALSRPDALERFVREARIAASLNSDHIVRVLDTTTNSDGTPLLIMELLHGRDLGSMLRDFGPVSASQAVDWVLQACVGLAEAHPIGIVHRDLKPSNMFLCRRSDGSEAVKLLDFGISKLSASTEVALTQEGGMLGSPPYMSPEQLLSSSNVDARSDLWSLGVILYQLVSGALPFSGSHAAQIAARITVGEITPLSRLAPHVPIALQQAVERCLQREPAARYESVVHLAESIDSLVDPPALGRLSRVRAVYEARKREGNRPVVVTTTGTRSTPPQSERITQAPVSSRSAPATHSSAAIRSSSVRCRQSDSHRVPQSVGELRSAAPEDQDHGCLERDNASTTKEPRARIGVLAAVAACVVVATGISLWLLAIRRPTPAAAHATPSQRPAVLEASAQAASPPSDVLEPAVSTPLSSSVAAPRRGQGTIKPTVAVPRTPHSAQVARDPLDLEIK
jgi:eukaryotic-like serine/threonine-protein kinase